MKYFAKNNILGVILIALIIYVTVFIGLSISGNKNKLQVEKTETQVVQQNLKNEPAVKIFTQNLNVPWAIAFLPNGEMLVTERAGKVRLIDKQGRLNSDFVAEINVDVENQGEGGLLGIALHPKFSANHFVYLYYTFKSEQNNTLNRVVKMTLNDNKLTNEKIIIDNIPGAIFHNGGRIKFGPDGFLYTTTGDAGDPSKAQSNNSLAGKILRTTDQGKITSGNPYNNLIFSYGHRNPQGIAWDASGVLWETEHGRSNPTGFDEVNLIQKGKNYGWEIIQGNEKQANMETPKINSGESKTWAPAGAAFVGESLFFAGLKGESLYEAVIQNNNIKELKTHFKGEFGRIREVIIGPDGMLYISTSNRDGRGNIKENDDKIIRVNPQKL